MQESGSGIVADIIWLHINCQANLQWGGGGHAQHPFRIPPGRVYCFI